MKDYKETLNLPKTSFPMKASLAQREPKIQKMWQKTNIYKQIRKARKGAKKFILHDGPPYANGHIHMGHALNKILKDMIIKYKTMQGYDAPFVPGWDCHGLPIEHRVLKEVLKGEEKDFSRIREECRKFAEHFICVQKEEFLRLGIFGDWERPYLTMEPSYCAKVIEAFSILCQKGYIYRATKPIHWCINCKTALAEAEVEYKEKESPSIYVAFPTKEGESVVIWTTTPWTLPANVAVALHPYFNYLLFEVNGKRYIVAEKCVEEFLSKIGKGASFLQKFQGKELEGKKLKHPFMEREVKVVLAEYVTLDQGTGCVHTAPGHGLEDYQTAKKYGLSVLCPVDEEGKFTKEVEFLTSQRVWDAEASIIKCLNEEGYLLHEERVLHSYPHCWRCKGPLIFRATSQWFIDLEKKGLRWRALEAVKSTEWIPRWGFDRIYGMVLQRTDWCISRQRAWGVPIIAFYCKECNHPLLSPEAINRVKEVVEKEGLEGWHKRDASFFVPDIDCPKCGARSFDKEKDIMDVWFESGVSFLAVLTQREELHFPADLYLEGSDQHRGWFQSSLLASMCAKDVAPFKAVLTHGFILDEEGRAMHKTTGNVLSPNDLVKQLGADVVRLWVCAQDYTEDVKIGSSILEQVVDSYRKVRNTIRFCLANLYDFRPADSFPYSELMELDKYILFKLHCIIEKGTEYLEGYFFYKFYHMILDFCNELSSFYFDVVKDRLYTEGAGSKKRRSAQTTLYHIIMALVRMLAPVLSYTAEEAWEHIPKEKERKVSVHLSMWPKVDEKIKDYPQKEVWQDILKVRDEFFKVLEAERRAGKLNQSLEASVNIYLPQREKFFEDIETFLKEVLIVSEVKVFDAPSLKVEVFKHKGTKCPRCWQYAYKEEQDLCERCKEVVQHH